MLLDYNVDVNAKNYEGLTAIGEARMNNKVKIVQIIEDRFRQDMQETFREPPRQSEQIDWERHRDPVTNKVRSRG